MNPATVTQPIYLTYDDVAARWRCHKTTAKRRLTLAGFPVMRFNDDSHALIKLSDLEKFEEARVEVLQYGDDAPRRVRKYRHPYYLKKKARTEHAAA
jgi:hypothetical protein